MCSVSWQINLTTILISKATLINYHKIPLFLLKRIADIMLEEVIARLKDKDMQLQQTRRFKDKVVAEGYDPSYEARLLRRVIMRPPEDCLAVKIKFSQVSLRRATSLLWMSTRGDVFLFMSKHSRLMPSVFY